jgi:hypothetical protein
MSGHFARGHGALATSPHMVGMSYRIRYYDKGGQEVGNTPWAESLEGTKRVAEAGIVRNKAASARIFDEDQNNRQVWPRA